MTDKFPTSWFLVILIPFGLLIPHITDPCENESEDSDPPAQELTAEMLPRFINISMNPCSDFYEFTCGIWKSEHPIGPCKSAINQFHILGDKVAAKMRATFESPEVLQSKSACTAKAIYRKCMDREELNRIGAKNMIREIREYSVSWPMLDRDKWRHERFNLTTLLIDALRKRGVQAFIRTDIITDPKNATRAVIEFSQGFLRLGPHRDHYLDKEKYKEKIDAYQKVFVKLVKLIHEETNVSIDEKAIAYDVGKIFEFESKLAGITEAKEDLRNFTEMYNLRRLSDVGILMPLIDWNTYFHSVAPSSIHKYLAADPPVLLAQIDYMRRLTNLLNSTDSVTITNYVYTAYSLALIDELGERYEGVAREFKYLTFGRKAKPRWKDCLDSTMKHMPYASGALYIKKATFNAEAKNATMEMIYDLQEAFHDTLLENDWLDNSTKTFAIDKASQMLAKIAYPDFILDDTKLDNYYSGLSIKESDSYSQMRDELNRWNNDFEYKRLVKPVDRNEFRFNPTSVNAYYDVFTNSIKFPAAILQAPFFHKYFPKALNYGGIGVVIGHEMTHGFDDGGSQHDAVGNLRNWWSAGVQKEFLKRAQCIVDQYGRIKVPETGQLLNGRLTQGENIADNGGVKVAFKAYKNYLKKYGTEKRIRGFEQFTDEQIFFIGYGMIWCGDETRESLSANILTDTHAPHKYRVNRVLANRPEFAAAFNCAVGTPMNPTTDRCAVW